MAVLNIAMPIQRKELMALLKEQKMPRYRLIKMISAMEAQYEVTDDGSHGDLVSYTKKLFAHTKYGGVIMFRVLYNGQFFEGGPILDKLKK
ncbi:MAG: hypothetical protein SOI44_00710 [Lactimicrobium sp.]|uniref:hypothetical protein n=1 Tax=Lactimicrobium sp. TaxID=2563780 RepID=UPI002F35D3E8